MMDSRADGPRGKGETAMDLDRLARFEAAAAELAAEYEDAGRTLETLRGQGLANTVRFRELLARRLADQRVLLLLKKHGIEARADAPEGTPP